MPTSTAHRNRAAAAGHSASRPPIDDTRIREIKELAPPSHLLREFPASDRAANTTWETRQAIHRVLHGADDRLLVVVGPCSIHDYDAAIDYATRLAAIRRELAAGPDRRHARLLREAPLDRRLEGTDQRPASRRQLPDQRGAPPRPSDPLEVNELELPAGTEYLDMITPQYIADLISWGAIGARTTESQVHRELASGLSCPVGFKNGTDGDVRIAVDAIRAASAPHHFLSVTKGGHSAIVHTAGNEDCHIILRGGTEPNFDAASVEATCRELAGAGLAARLMIDCSHANSRKQHERQVDVARDVATQIAGGDARIIGAMLESHLNPGRQELAPGKELLYGVSITDACIGWEATVDVLRALALAVRERRVRVSDTA